MRGLSLTDLGLASGTPAGSRKGFDRELAIATHRFRMQWPDYGHDAGRFMTYWTL